MRGISVVLRTRNDIIRLLLLLLLLYRRHSVAQERMTVQQTAVLYQLPMEL
jgi:hypothetical protein